MEINGSILKEGAPLRDDKEFWQQQEPSRLLLILSQSMKPSQNPHLSSFEFMNRPHLDWIRHTLSP